MTSRRIKTESLLVLFILCFSLIPLSFASVSTTNTVSSDTDSPRYTTCQLLDYGGYFYSFYINNNDDKIYYKSSQDGVTFGSETSFSNSSVINNFYTNDRPFCAYNYNSTVVLAYNSNSKTIMLRNGTLSNGTIINWFEKTTNIVAASSTGSQYADISLTSTSNHLYMGIAQSVTALFGAQAYILVYNFTKTKIGPPLAAAGTYLGQEASNNIGVNIAAIPGYSDRVLFVFAKYSENIFRYAALNNGVAYATGTFGSKTINKDYIYGLKLVSNSTHLMLAYTKDLQTGNQLWFDAFDGAGSSWSAPTLIVNSTNINFVTDIYTDKFYVLYTKNNETLNYRAQSTADYTFSDEVQIKSFNYSPNGGIKNVVTSPTTSYDGRLGILSQDNTTSPRDLRLTVLNVTVVGCTPQNVTLLNPEADGWVFADEKFYLFESTYLVNLTSSTQTEYYFQTSDGYHNITLSYDIDSHKYTVENGSDYARVPMNNQTGYVTYDSATSLLTIDFSVFFSIKIEDTLGASISLNCGSEDYTTVSETYNIYNHGGLVQQSVTSNDANATFTTGGEWFEGCVTSDLNSLYANQTWRKLQHWSGNYILRAYIWNGTGWIGEDQFFQSQGNAGGGEEWLGQDDWQFRVKLYAWDKVTEQWIVLAKVIQDMNSGDKDSTAEWIGLKDRFLDGQNDFKGSTIYFGWIDTEPSTAVSQYFDLWFNKINASSVIGMRSSPEFYGIVNSGTWPFWTDWHALQEQNYSAQTFIPLLDGNGVKTVASQYDLMKLSIEFASITNSSSSSPWRICVTDVKANTIKLQEYHNVMMGIDTPIFQEPKTPEKTISGFFAPLLSGIMWIVNQAIAALTSAGAFIWSFVRSQFPWFADFYDNLSTFITNGLNIANTMFTGVTSLLGAVAGQFWIFGFIVDFITQVWITIGPVITLFSDHLDIWITLLIIVFGIIPFQINLERGNTGAVRHDLEMVWGFMRTIIVGTYFIVMKFVDWIISVIP